MKIKKRSLNKVFSIFIVSLLFINPILALVVSEISNKINYKIINIGPFIITPSYMSREEGSNSAIINFTLSFFDNGEELPENVKLNFTSLKGTILGLNHLYINNVDRKTYFTKQGKSRSYTLPDNWVDYDKTYNVSLDLKVNESRRLNTLLKFGVASSSLELSESAPVICVNATGYSGCITKSSGTLSYYSNNTNGAGGNWNTPTTQLFASIYAASSGHVIGYSEETDDDCSIFWNESMNNKLVVKCMAGEGKANVTYEFFDELFSVEVYSGIGEDWSSFTRVNAQTTAMGEYLDHTSGWTTNTADGTGTESEAIIDHGILTVRGSTSLNFISELTSDNQMDLFINESYDDNANYFMFAWGKTTGDEWTFSDGERFKTYYYFDSSTNHDFISDINVTLKHTDITTRYINGTQIESATINQNYTAFINLNDVYIPPEQIFIVTVNSPKVINSSQTFPLNVSLPSGYYVSAVIYPNETWDNFYPVLPFDGAAIPANTDYIFNIVISPTKPLYIIGDNPKTNNNHAYLIQNENTTWQNWESSFEGVYWRNDTETRYLNLDGSPSLAIGTFDFYTGSSSQCAIGITPLAYTFNPVKFQVYCTTANGKKNETIIANANYIKMTAWDLNQNYSIGTQGVFTIDATANDAVNYYGTDTSWKGLLSTNAGPRAFTDDNEGHYVFMDLVNRDVFTCRFGNATYNFDNRLYSFDATNKFPFMRTGGDATSKNYFDNNGSTWFYGIDWFDGTADENATTACGAMQTRLQEGDPLNPDISLTDWNTDYKFTITNPSVTAQHLYKSIALPTGFGCSDILGIFNDSNADGYWDAGESLLLWYCNGVNIELSVDVGGSGTDTYQARTLPPPKDYLIGTETYNATTNELTNNSFKLNIWINSSTVGATTARLYYNGSLIMSGINSNTTIDSSNFTAYHVTPFLDYNNTIKNFNWDITLNYLNATADNTVNSSIHTQALFYYSYVLSANADPNNLTELSDTTLTMNIKALEIMPTITAYFGFNDTNYTTVGTATPYTRDITIPLLNASNFVNFIYYGWVNMSQGDIWRIENSSTAELTGGRVFVTTDSGESDILAINFTIEDEINSTDIFGDFDVEIVIWLNATYNRTYNFDLNNATNASFYISPPYDSINTSIHIIYTGTVPGWVDREYILDTTLTNSTDEISLYLLDDALDSELQVTATDNSGEGLEGILVVIKRKFLDSGDIRTISRSKTNNDGQTNIPIQVDGYYRIELYQGGVLKEYTAYNRIFASDLTKPFNIEEAIFRLLERQINIEYSTANTTTTFSFTVKDNLEEMTHLTLKIRQRTLAGSKSVCDTKESLVNYEHTITCENIEDGYSYIIVAIGHYADGEEITIWSGGWDRTSTTLRFGKQGLFIGAIVVGSMGFMALFDPVISLLLTIVGFIATSAIGLTVVSIPMLISMIIIGIIVLVSLL